MNYFTVCSSCPFLCLLYLSEIFISCFFVGIVRIFKVIEKCSSAGMRWKIKLLEVFSRENRRLWVDQSKHFILILLSNKIFIFSFYSITSLHYFKLKYRLREKPYIFDFESINAGYLESLKLLKHLVFNICQNVFLAVHGKQLFLMNSSVLMNCSFPIAKKIFTKLIFKSSC